MLEKFLAIQMNLDDGHPKYRKIWVSDSKNFQLLLDLNDGHPINSENLEL